MRVITFPKAATYSPTQHNVYVKIRLPDAKTPTVITAMLDTGAGVTILNHKYAKHIGIDNVRGGEKISFTTATNQKLLAWIHPVRIEFMGKPMTIDVAFAPTVETANLLGMRSFFEQLTIAFDHKDRRVDFAFR